MRCLSQNKSDTKLFRVYLFTVFTIKRPRALASLAPLGLLMVKTVTNILIKFSLNEKLSFLSLAIITVIKKEIKKEHFEITRYI